MVYFEIIKELGENGGGFFGINFVYFFENFNNFVNFLEMVIMMVIFVGFIIIYGIMVGNFE